MLNKPRATYVAGLITCWKVIAFVNQPLKTTLGLASHADVLRGSSRVPAPCDEPLRTSAWEATLGLPDKISVMCL